MSARRWALLLGVLAACAPERPAEPGGHVASAKAADLDADGWDDGLDCDDTDPDVHPDASEVCNAGDDDCDGQIDEEGCACTPAHDGRHPFLFCTAAATWADAQAACAGWGYHLADVDDATEDLWVWTAAEAESSTNWWLGYTDTATEGTWAWDGGSDSPYTHWRAGEPNDYAGGEDCAWYAPAGGGAWNDKDCTATAAYVCEAGCATSTRYPDDDTDGFGDAASPTRVCADEAGYIDDGTDCDDADPAVNPAAVEVCDGADTDEDCDGTADDADPGVDAGSFSTFYVDADGDGPAGGPDAAGDAPAGAAPETDCDDADPTVSPDAVDLAGDGVDDDCTGADSCTWYADADGDGWGDDTAPAEDCAGAPASHVAAPGDCDDADGAVFPGAPDAAYDGVDADCAGDSDEDADGDGVDRGTDCDDDDDTVFPGAAEACDGADDDCDGVIDQGAGCPGEAAWYDDHAYFFVVTAAAWPDAQAACAAWGYHLLDLRDAAESAWAWSTADAADPDHRWWLGANDRAAEGTFVWEGASPSTYTDWRTGEPNDYGGNEDCAAFADDGAGQWVDRDCAEAVPYVCEAGCEPFSVYVDADADGFGDPATEAQACTVPAGGTTDASDCDDGDADTSPLGHEVCGEPGGDEDCDGRVDDDDDTLDPTGLPTWYEDLDGAGAGTDAATWVACRAPPGWAAAPDDCADDDAAIHPGADDPDDGVDADCDGADETTDADGDGAPDTAERRHGLDPTVADTDGDGLRDGDELGDPATPTDSDDDGAIDAADPDDDDDGVPTAEESADGATMDTDADGAPDHLDRDSDGDGRGDADEVDLDSDHDGVPNRREADDDGDGRPTTAEDAADPDPDHDGVPNALDQDSDGDGCTDAEEPDATWLDAASGCAHDTGDPTPPDPDPDCGCSTGTPWPTGALVGAAALLRRRRRG